MTDDFDSRIYGLLEDYEKKKTISEFRRGYKEGAKSSTIKVRTDAPLRDPEKMSPYQYGLHLGTASNLLKRGFISDAIELYAKLKVLPKESVIKKLLKQLEFEKKKGPGWSQADVLVRAIRNALEARKAV